MKIWELRHDSYNYAVFLPVDKKMWTLDYIHSFHGSSKLKEWTKLPVTLDRDEKSFPLTDFPGFNYTPLLVFSAQSAEKLYPLIRADAELLPLDFENRTYYGINVMSILDCVDLTKSSFKRFQSSGRIMLFTHLSFQKNRLADHHLFRLTEGPMFYYVSDDFNIL